MSRSSLSSSPLRDRRSSPGLPDAGRADVDDLASCRPNPTLTWSVSVRLAGRHRARARVRDVARVMFYADGRLVCTLMDPTRAECPWDAGANIKEHVIRAVAEMMGGGRAVTSMRTKGLDIVGSRERRGRAGDRRRRRPRSLHQGTAKADFRLLEDDVPQKITHFSSEGSPLELVIAD